jgi:hypothetical protein
LLLVLWSILYCTDKCIYHAYTMLVFPSLYTQNKKYATVTYVCSAQLLSIVPKPNDCSCTQQEVYQFSGKLSNFEY